MHQMLLPFDEIQFFLRLELYQKELFPYLTQTEIDEVSPYLSHRKVFFPNKENLMRILDKYFEISRIVESEGIGYWGRMHAYVIRRK